MKRDAEIALRAYFEALAADPIPAIEIRLGRPVSGPALPVAAGVCAAVILPLFAPPADAPAQPVTGVASLGDELDPEPHTFLEGEAGTCLA